MCGLTSMSIPELAGLMEELGQPKFRARQVFEWISRGKRPQEMTNLPKELRDKLDTLHYGGASIYDKRVSAKDGTIKYLFQLEDGNIVEGVLYELSLRQHHVHIYSGGLPHGLRILCFHA